MTAPRILLVVLSLLGASVSIGVARAQEGTVSPSRLASRSGTVEVGSPARSFGGWTLRDGPWSMDRHRKRHGQQVLVVSFFATWCQPCARSIPALNEIRRNYPADRVEIILVAFGQEGAEVERFVDEKKAPGIVVVDPFQKIGERFGVDRSLPRTFVIDPDGIVRAIFVAEGADFGPMLSSVISDAMKTVTARR